MFPEDQVKELKSVYPEVFACQEGGIGYILIKNLPLPKGCTPRSCDALLCPTERDGYPTRLYFAQHIQGRERNWNGNIRILERNWFAFSWKQPGGTNLRLAQMVKVHLRGLQ